MKRLKAMGFLAILVGLLLTSVAPCVRAEEPLDLNRATLEEIMKLPISEDTARAIWERKEFRSYFASVYELRELPEIGQAELNLLKPLVKIVAVPIEDEELKRVNDIYYRIRNWEAEEGASEALVDHWIDLAKDPFNVNEATYGQVANLQTLSPPDAAAIYRYTRLNRIERQTFSAQRPGAYLLGLLQRAQLRALRGSGAGGRAPGQLPVPGLRHAVVLRHQRVPSGGPEPGERFLRFLVGPSRSRPTRVRSTSTSCG